MSRRKQPDDPPDDEDDTDLWVEEDDYREGGD